MNVASFDICKELYELSGWGVKHDFRDCDYWWFDNSNGNGEWIVQNIQTATIGYIKHPAYDLGYMLQKLPQGFGVTKQFLTGKRSGGAARHQYHATYPMDDKWTTGYEADTPEDAAVKLAIELFKKNVLKRA